MFNRYKSDKCLDRTGVQGDFTVIGAGVVNFLSTVATCRIVRKARWAGLLDKMTYGDLMDDFSSAWRKTDALAAPSQMMAAGYIPSNVYFEELEALGLSEPVPKPELKKWGRKPKDPGPKPKRP